MAEILTDSKFRTLDGAPRVVEHALLGGLTGLGALWAAEAHHWLPLAIFKEQYLGVFLALGLAGVFVAVRPSVRAAADRVAWFDWILAAAGLGVGLYVAILFPSLAYQLGVISWDKVLLGAIAVPLILEATRRLVGWTLVWIAVACILYAKFAWILPGAFHAKGSSWERLAVYLYLDSNALFGVALSVTASIVVAFILFGQALYAVGGDRFLTDVSLVAMGRYRGGSAKVAVVSSTLFGTVSGSAVSNVVVDGAVTIPMMKRAGYPPHLAAAIEAVASNGGQIMPPVMGAAAFLMAEYLGAPYGTIALAALLPALLYYLALFTQVDLEAARHGLVGLPADQLPRLRAVMRSGWVFVVPLAVLVHTLMIAGWDAAKSGMLAVAVTFAVGAVFRESRPSVRRALRTLVESGRVLLDLIAITALAGLVIGAFQLSGFTSKLPLILLDVAGGSLLLLLVLSALVCVVLGMSLPTTVVYITLAVLVAPALTQLGIAPIAAHLFLFYYGMLSLITPPNCLATFAAAAIARSDFWKTGWTGMRLGIVAYLVPFVFVYQPALLFQGSPGEIVLAVVTAAAGVILLSAGCVGYLLRPLDWTKRTLFIAAGLALIPPPAGAAWIMTNVVGLSVGVALVVWERRARALTISGPRGATAPIAPRAARR
ncbi:MAG: TRAP transporter fused permease subunit [Candidatus Rokubacteria bacterium]|nr:TRAP transporter fused permease subunit [Candidatus Rokubacteria bacterium]